ncbi:MAG: SUF system NifU family Fe-S cluster assembly protein [Chloroflexi bacterium]|nr:SUF system NifU family Fe-S cluster assembly protein [Chloroflexota bacterium]
MQLDELDDLYREVILDHYRRSRNPQHLADAEVQADGNNPFCGDEVALQVKLNGRGVIQAMGRQGKGCAISQASASMLTEVLQGKTLQEAERLGRAFRRMMQGEPLQAQEREALGPLEALEGVRKFPIRIKCALLAWSILEEGVESYRRRQG